MRKYILPFIKYKNKYKNELDEKNDLKLLATNMDPNINIFVNSKPHQKCHSINQMNVTYLFNFHFFFIFYYNYLQINPENLCRY